ncbi:hypothetical protein Btru_047592 [Bulinus truncatus]|nr:hypothetical protein Btru_047592 [Bulinus truncatus]
MSLEMMCLGYVSRGNESLGYVSRGNESLGNVSRGNGSLGYVSRGNESLGNVSRGNESLGYVSRGNGSLGYVSRGNESLGNVSRGNGSLETLDGNPFRQSISAGFHFDQLLSVVISTVNSVDGENETIASVTGCSTPVIEKTFLDLVQAEGSTERSSEKDKQGYLYLTWNNPNEKHASRYTSEVSFLNLAKHTSVISTSLDIVSVDPTIADLVNYISDSEKTQLTRQINELQANYTELRDVVEEHDGIHTNLNLTTTIINDKLGNIKGQNSQTGEIKCLLNEINHVTFLRPFENVPTVNLMLSYFYAASSSYISFRNNLTYVNTTGFGVNCNRPSSLTSISLQCQSFLNYYF